MSLNAGGNQTPDDRPPWLDALFSGEQHFDHLADPLRAWAWGLSAFLASGAAARALADVAGDSEGWPEVVVPRADDVVFLTTALLRDAPGGSARVSPWCGDVIAVYDAARLTGRPVGDVVLRARQLGLRLPERAEELPESTDVVRSLLTDKGYWGDSPALPRSFGWPDLEPVAAHHGLTLRQLCGALAEQRIPLHDSVAGLLDAPPTPLERILAKRKPQGLAPWRSLGSGIRLDDLWGAANEAGVELDEAAGALGRLGYSVSLDPHLEGVRLDGDDIELLRRQVGSDEFLESGEGITPKRLRRSARRLGLPIDEVTRRYRRLGHPLLSHLPEAEWWRHHAKSAHIRRLRRFLSESAPAPTESFRQALTMKDVAVAAIDDSLTEFRPLDVVVEELDVLHSARRYAYSIGRVVKRLRRLGYRVLIPSGQTRAADTAAFVLLSRRLTGRPPWRGPGESVTATEVWAVSRITRASIDEVLDRLRLWNLVLAAHDDRLPTMRPGPIGNETSEVP